MLATAYNRLPKHLRTNGRSSDELTKNSGTLPFLDANRGYHSSVNTFSVATQLF